jgi:hypothetical protein
VVAYDDNVAMGWPNDNDAGSIFLANLTANPATPSSWTLSNNNNSSTPQAVLAEVVDHPGGDVGSPGFVPGVVVVPLDGDYNGNGIVDAGDYIWWRKNDRTPTGYTTWRTNFGRTGPAASGLEVTSVPEPMSGVMVVIASMVFVGRTVSSVRSRRWKWC